MGGYSAAAFHQHRLIVLPYGAVFVSACMEHTILVAETENCDWQHLIFIFLRHYDGFVIGAHDCLAILGSQEKSAI